jgi:hypothetical protein
VSSERRTGIFPSGEMLPAPRIAPPLLPRLPFPAPDWEEEAAERAEREREQQRLEQERDRQERDRLVAEELARIAADDEPPEQLPAKRKWRS